MEDDGGDDTAPMMTEEDGEDYIPDQKVIQMFVDLLKNPDVATGDIAALLKQHLKEGDRDAMGSILMPHVCAHFDRRSDLIEILLQAGAHLTANYACHHLLVSDGVEADVLPWLDRMMQNNLSVITFPYTFKRQTALDYACESAQERDNIIVKLLRAGAWPKYDTWVSYMASRQSDESVLRCLQALKDEYHSEHGGSWLVRAVCSDVDRPKTIQWLASLLPKNDPFLSEMIGEWMASEQSDDVVLAGLKAILADCPELCGPGVHSTLLHGACASSQKRLGCIEALIQAGVDIAFNYDWGTRCALQPAIETAWHVLVKSGKSEEDVWEVLSTATPRHPEIIHLLDEQGCSLLHAVGALHSLSRTKTLRFILGSVEAGDRKHFVNIVSCGGILDGFTALHHACAITPAYTSAFGDFASRTPLVRWLLRAGAVITASEAHVLPEETEYEEHREGTRVADVFDPLILVLRYARLDRRPKRNKS